MHDYCWKAIDGETAHTVKKKKLSQLKILRQPASADFWVFSTYFLGNFSTFCCINLKQEVEKTKKSAEAGCLKILSLPNFFILQCTLMEAEECFASTSRHWPWMQMNVLTIEFWGVYLVIKVWFCPRSPTEMRYVIVTGRLANWLPFSSFAQFYWTHALSSRLLKETAS